MKKEMAKGPEGKTAISPNVVDKYTRVYVHMPVPAGCSTCPHSYPPLPLKSAALGLQKPPASEREADRRRSRLQTFHACMQRPGRRAGLSQAGTGLARLLAKSGAFALLTGRLEARQAGAPYRRHARSHASCLGQATGDECVGSMLARGRCMHLWGGVAMGTARGRAVAVHAGALLEGKGGLHEP